MERIDMSRRTFAGMGMGMAGMMGLAGMMSAPLAGHADDSNIPTLEEIQAAEIAAAKAENRRLNPVKFVTTMSDDELVEILENEAEVTEDYVTPGGKVIPAIYVRLRNHINRASAGIGSKVTGDNHWDVLMHWWSEEDAKHEIDMPVTGWFTAAEYADKTGLSEAESEAILDDMADRYLIWRVRRTGVSFYGVMTMIVGFWEWKQLHIAATGTPEELTQFNIDCDNVWGEDRPTASLYRPLVRVQPVSRDIVDGDLTPWTDWEAAIERYDRFAVMPCQCRTKRAALGTESPECDCNWETCLSMGEIAEYYIAGGIARELTRDEARAVMQSNVEMGNTIEAFCNKSGGAYCACNLDCCLFANAYKALEGGFNSMPYLSDYNLTYDKDACLQCGSCMERCPMKAIEIDEDGYYVPTTMCFRCGQCALPCPVGARKLTPKEKWETFELSDDVMDDSVTNAKVRIALGGLADFTGDVDEVVAKTTIKIV